MNSDPLLITQIVMGILTFILGTSSAIPQMITLRKTRNTSGISLISFIIVNIDNAFWIIWTFGFYFNSMLMYEKPMTRIYQISLLILCFAYVFGSILVAYLLAVKIIHIRKAKQYHVTELELANILLEQDKHKYFVEKWNNGKRYLLPILFIIGDAIFTFAIVAILYKYAYWQPVSGSKEWVWVVVISFISSGIWEASCWPQFIKSIKEKDTTGMSMFWCVFSALNCCVNFVYDITLSLSGGKFNYDVLFIIIFSALIPNIGVLVIKLINYFKAKKMGLNEVEYTKKVLIPLVEEKKKKKLEKKSSVK